MDFTIIDKLFEQAREKPDSIAFRYMSDLESLPQEISYKNLWEEAGAIAEFILQITTPGSRVMLFFPPGLAYIKAFYACLMAGVIAVPLYPPRRSQKSDRLINVAISCDSSVALTIESELKNIQVSLCQQTKSGLPLALYASDSIPVNTKYFIYDQTDTALPAFLQYTSGSTGIPKGVIITHENIIANVKHLSLMAGGSANDVFVNWLPLFHDLGLITAVLWPVYLGATSVLMAPATFVRNPSLWLKAITHYKGSVCGAPNFSYDLCTNRISEADLASIDLSSWRVAYNAAEPVRADTLNKFSTRFSVCRFQEEAFYPGYGMAEATVFITGGSGKTKPMQLTVNKKMLSEKILELVDSANIFATTIVSCGTADLPHSVRIVDPDSHCELPQGQVGEIWFSGPSVSPGYWQLDELNAKTFNQVIVGNKTQDTYLRTGDLGVKWNHELFVTGRIKDLIILHGKNYYPQDIEASAVSAHIALRQGYCAAFSISNANGECLVVVVEVEREHFRNVAFDEIFSAIRQSIASDHDANVDHIVLLKPYKIPVTSSGKIQRQKTQQLYLDNQLDTIAETLMSSNREYIAPKSEAEYLLADIWCSALKLKKISVTDDFFDVGGSSLTALEISAAIKKQFAIVELDVEHFLRFPTIVQLAEFLELKASHLKSKQTPLITQRNRIIKI